MIGWVVAAIFGACLVSYAIAGYMSRGALRGSVMDIPNERSSHTVPTPRGGGVGIVAGATVAIVVLALERLVSVDLAIVLLAGGLIIAAVGFVDDRRSLPVGIRLAAHIAIALLASLMLGGLQSIQFGSATLHPGPWGHLLNVVGIVWVLNLFNFMDGIDGIAGSEAVFVTAAGAALMLGAGGGVGTALCALVVGAAALGFLAWNWPPARIFMGDVGSGYLGYVIACLTVAAANDRPPALFAWLILGAVFVTDATCTLLIRLRRGEAVYQPHRSHLYQRLARRWDSHAKVTRLCVAVNVMWLLPLAGAATLLPAWAPLLALLSITPLVGAVVVFARATPP